MKLGQMHAILSAKIDYPYKLQCEGRHLSKEIINHKDWDCWDQVEKTVYYVIMKELPDHLKECSNLLIETEIVGFRQGSLLVYFGIILLNSYRIYETISKYKSFIESVELIKNQCKYLLNRALKNQFKNIDAKDTFASDFDITVSVEIPIITGPREELNQNLFSRLRRYVPISLTSSQALERPNGFFSYLIIINIMLFTMNIIALVLIIVLIYKAVSKIYFL
jgi:hypothetical protein